MRNNYYFILRKEILNLECDYKDHLICILSYLQSNKNALDLLNTNIKFILKNVFGYDYNYHSSSKIHIEKIRESLNKLCELNYIHKIYSEDLEPFESVDSFKNTDLMIIEVNSAIADYTSEGFLSVPIEHWKAIYKYCISNNFTIVRKMFRIYCEIMEKIFYPIDERNEVQIINTPYYCKIKVSELYGQLDEGYNFNNIKSIIEILDSLNVLHKGNVTSVKSPDGAYSNIGMVFVRDHNLWELELNTAINKEKNNRRNYYGAKKKGDS